MGNGSTKKQIVQMPYYRYFSRQFTCALSCKGIERRRKRKKVETADEKREEKMKKISNSAMWPIHTTFRMLCSFFIEIHRFIYGLFSYAVHVISLLSYHIILICSVFCLVLCATLTQRQKNKNFNCLHNLAAIFLSNLFHLFDVNENIADLEEKSISFEA